MSLHSLHCTICRQHDEPPYALGDAVQFTLTGRVTGLSFMDGRVEVGVEAVDRNGEKHLAWFMADDPRLRQDPS